MNSKTLQQRIIFRRLIQILIIVGIFLMALTDINHENDIFWQLKMGEDIFKYHFFPIRDIYSSSAYGFIWTLHEWIPSVIFYLIYTYLDSAALILFKASLIAITFSLFLFLFNKLKINLYISLIVFVLAALVNTRGIWVVFPSIFEYLFIVITLYLLEIFNKENSVKISIFLSFFSLIWSNSHGSFFLLPIILSAFTFGHLISNILSKKYNRYKPLTTNSLNWPELKILVLPFIVGLFTPLVTPNGVETWIYPFKISFGSFTSYVSEYQKFWDIWRWNWNDYVTGYSLVLMLIMWSIFLFFWKRVNLYDLFFGSFFTLLALTAARHMAIFALAALFIIAKYTKIWMGEYRGILARSLLKDILVVVLILCSVYFYKTRVVPFGFNLTEDGYPKAAAELINESGIEGNMFNHYNYGGYLIWKMPKYKVFIDGRLEMYLNNIGDDYETIISGATGYKELLRKYKINYFISYLRDPIISKLVDDSDWKYIFHDDQYVIFVRNTEANQRLLSKYWSDEKSQSFKDSFKKEWSKYLADYYNNLGLENLKSGKLIDSINNFQTAIELDPDNVIVRMNLARAYIELGSLTEAKKEYDYILKINPGNAQAKKNMEQIQKILGGETIIKTRIW